MNIKPVVYESLTPRQRVIASIEALARGDEEERIRLVKSCPKKNYKQNDSAYTDKMDILVTLPAVIECDLRGCALNYFITLWLEAKDQKSLFDDKMKFLQDAANITAAWHNILRNEGIDPETMDKANDGLTHHAIQWMQNFMPEPDREGVKDIQDALEKYLGGSSVALT